MEFIYLLANLALHILGKNVLREIISYMVLVCLDTKIEIQTNR